ncbi:hypothetical protein [Achromobacter xylosoxidans]|uniref:hypothetical protein n=1 Tax=Alcaligenes xylosoxydans xylosoxydans TaxID=85698 RepID=UPI001F137F74|nr:hypothetical protein [Achromobacter xylosoxidans]
MVFALKNFLRFLVVGIPAGVVVGGVTLSLLGYGAAWAIETTFGVPREMTYGSTLDLLNLASLAILGWTEALNLVYVSIYFKEFALALMGFGAALTVLIIFLKNKKEDLKGGDVDLNGKKRSEDNRVWKAVKRVLGWIGKERFSLLPFVALTLAPWFSVFILMSVVFLFALIPVMGHEAAAKQLREWVVAAEYCAPLSTREERLAPKIREEMVAPESKKYRITTCVSVWKNGVALWEGRHVASTEKHTIIFDPSNGQVGVIPLDGVVMRPAGLPIVDLRAAINGVAGEDLK